MRVGIGYDVHGFDEHRPLVLGGVRISEGNGLAGWSDADVVSHAIADALLGAAGLGDLGEHFSQEQVPEGVSSLQLLSHTAALLAGAGFSIVNVDATVVIQEARIAPYRNGMITRIAQTLGIPPSRVSVKATTTDGLGFTGRREGSAGLAIALLEGGS